MHALAKLLLMKAGAEMVKIARWTMAHRRTVVVAWIVAAIGIFAVSSSVGKKTASSFTLPGTGSQQAVDLLQSRFPAQAGDADQIVFHAKTGKLTDAADRPRSTRRWRASRGCPTSPASSAPTPPGQHAISRDGTIALRDRQLRRARERAARRRRSTG